MDRRLFIKAACGTSLALPAFGESSEKNVNKRLLIFCNHLGFHLPYLLPKKNNELDSPYLNLFQKFHSKMTVLTNMSYKGRNGLHKSPRALLTGTANGLDSHYSPSLDQVLASHVQKGAIYPSLISRANDGWGITANYSWQMNGKPSFAEKNPYRLYNKLFNKFNNGQYLKEKSVLDRLTKPIAKLEKTLSPQEKEQLNVYLDAVNGMDIDLKRRVKISHQHPYKKILRENLTYSNLALYNLRSQIDMSVYAFLNNITNICVTGIVGSEASGLRYIDRDQHNTTHGSYHTLSHHGNGASKLKELKGVEVNQLSSLANAVSFLDSMPEGNGTMLDNTIVAIFAGHANPNNHTVEGRPVILIGGNLNHKQMIDCKGRNSSDLLVTLCHAMGKPVKKFANSQGDFNGELL